MKSAYVVLDEMGDSLFNYHTQNNTFPSIRACKKAIKEELDTVQGEDLEGNIFTLRDEDVREKDYQIFKRV